MKAAAVPGGLLFVLLVASCASVPPAKQGEQTQSAAPHVAVVGSAPADETATPSTTGSTNKSANKTTSSGAEIVADASARPASPSQVPKTTRIAPEIARHQASPFDLTSLEKRLKETEAIDVLAKIALRKQVDELLSQFRAFYQGTLKTSLGELRQPYDLLILRVLSLLQDNDPALAAAIVASREAIWGILADPAKFAKI